MTPVLVIAVILAQALDAATWAAMPAAAEANRLIAGIAGMHSAAGWTLKAALVVLVFAVELLIRFAPPPRFRAVAVVNRILAEVLVVLAIAVGSIGAGANLSVLTAIASETPRSVQEPAPIASEATGIEQGAIAAPAAPGRTPAPLGQAPAASVRGRASWYATPGSVAAAGPALRQARLAPLAAGLIVVRVGSVRLVPPATDTE